MKKFFTLLFVVMTIVGSIWASNTQVGGIWYDFDSKNLTASVTYNGSDYYSYDRYQGAVVIPSSVTYNDQTYTVTSIGQYAFAGCYFLTAVTIPSSTTSIGKGAFWGCTSLTNVTIPHSVTSLEMHAFKGCTSLAAVTIGNSVNRLGGETFVECNKLKSVTIHSDYIMSNVRLNAVFGDQVTTYIVGSEVTSIGDMAFYNCSSMTSVTLPKSITSIGNSAFYNCTGLTSMTIPNNVTSIGKQAFSDCTGLTSMTIPNDVTSIGDLAFTNCTGLKSVVWNARNCNGCAFGNQVESFTFGDEVEVIPASICSKMDKLTSITIPNSVTSIGTSAFYGCSGLTSMTIPNGVTSIGHLAFRGCSGLRSVTIPNSVTSIGNNAFARCTGLTSVTIPNSVTSIGSDAFEYCIALKTVTIGNGDISIGERAFMSCNNLTTIYVPCGEFEHFQQMLPEYKNAIKYKPAQYKLTVNYSMFGNVKISEHTTICDTIITLTSVPDYGYHFAQWSDGNTDNPRTIILTQDTTFSAEYAKNSYTITTESDSPELGAATGGQSALYLDRIEISATANYGYHFISWNDGSTQNPRTVTVTEDQKYTATFAKNIYNITKNAVHGSISGPSQAEYLDEVALTANSDDGYHFTQWSDGNTDNPRTIILTQDTAFIAEFAKNTYTITTKSNHSEWGTVNGGQSVLYLDEIEISATANYGYHFVQWNDGNTQNPRTVSVTEDKTYTATFAKNAYSVSVESSNSTQGTVFGAGTFAYLDQKHIEAIANYGFHFTQWSDGNTDNPRTIILMQDTTFSAEFAKNSYTITTKSNHSEWGTVNGGQSALYLEEIEISATANYGYHFVQWNDGNTQNPRTVSVTEDKTYTATFAKNAYSVSVESSNSTQGTVFGAGTFAYLDQKHIEAIANYGFHFTQWSDGNTDNPRTIILTQDTAFTAEFTKNTYTITTESNHSEWGTVNGGQSALYLEEIEISATANYGYHFISWNDGSTQNPRTVTVTEDQKYTATFAKNTYNITTNAEHGSISGLSQAEYLDEVALTANSDYGYHFTQWSDGNTDNPRTIILTQDTTITAEFAKNTYTITTKSNHSEWGTANGGQSALYLEEIEISATANYGYYFKQWNDGNKKNHRVVTVTGDKTYTATFAKNIYYITKNAVHGSISGPSQAEYLDKVALTANSDYGYHFTQWSDGNTDNPRTFVITGDTAFTAEFVKNTYTITMESNDSEWGTANGGQSALYLEEIEISATANYGYHFISWNDGNTQNPRVVTITGDKTYTATFAKNTYNITTNAEHGSISGPSQAEYLDEVALTANSDYGYHFTQWSDGNTDNPRTIILTQDTAFTAEFAIDKSGTCGKDDALTWSYDDQSKTLAITGNGILTENYTFGVEAPTEMNILIIGDSITAIGDSAFYGISTINHLYIGANVASIGNYAFAECRNFDDITCYATIVPTINATTFANVGNKQYIYLYVPENRERAYHRDEFWGEFDIRIKGTEETTTNTNSVTVDPSDNTALFTWPIDDDAASYSLQISKDGVVFCTLVFNSNGQLTGISFAPSRDGVAHAQAATMSVSAMSFTVTGLNSASKYAYRLSVTDESQNEIQAYSGEFATSGYEGEVTLGGEPEINTEGIEDVHSTEKISKILRNGQIYILCGDKTYTIQGQEVK